MKPLILFSALLSSTAFGADADLAKQLSNPVADLISLPIQSNLDFGLGPGDGSKWSTNIQPVIPFGLNEDWNVISRTIVPLVEQEGIALGGANDEFGLGDITQSFFFSPKESDPIWGIGPVFLLPTATDDVLGTDKWGIGPTAVVLKQCGHWTFGTLANHLWDVAGDDDRAGVNATFIQPFMAYTTPQATTFTINSETSYDWQREQWTVPLNFVVSQLLKIGEHPVQIFGGVRYYVEKPDQGPEWGVRFGITFLFPK